MTRSEISQRSEISLDSGVKNLLKTVIGPLVTFQFLKWQESLWSFLFSVEHEPDPDRNPTGFCNSDRVGLDFEKTLPDQ